MQIPIAFVGRANAVASSIRVNAHGKGFEDLERVCNKVMSTASVIASLLKMEGKLSQKTSDAIAAVSVETPNYSVRFDPSWQGRSKTAGPAFTFEPKKDNYVFLAFDETNMTDKAAEFGDDGIAMVSACLDVLEEIDDIIAAQAADTKTP